MADTIHPQVEWRLRPAILAVIGALAALAVQQLIIPETYSSTGPAEWRVGLAIAIGTGAFAFGFGLERVRWTWAVAFALIAASVAGLIHHWSGTGNGLSWFEDWRVACFYFGIAVTVPLFQTARDEGAWRFPYAEVHSHAWTNVVLWFACWAFVGIAFALAFLLGSLFDLIGLRFLSTLLTYHWFIALLYGAAFGGGLALLRERDRIVRLLQRVVTAVLAVLAPVLAVGLVIFLIALPFTGLSALWDATRATTPVLLCCVIGALILANAVIGNGADEELPNPVLRWSAMALGLTILPLSVIAAVATGLRIGQYGITPDRLWALVFVILATAYGVAYFVALVRGRLNWAAHIRPANLTLAFVVAGICLFLAMPILSFNTMSTHAQVARLESGKVSADDFDWTALAFDFGAPGKQAVARLAKSPNAAIAKLAKQALAAPSRYDMPSAYDKKQNAERRASAATRALIVRPVAVPVPQALRDAIFTAPAAYLQPPCNQPKASCLLSWQPGADIAVVIEDSCFGKSGDDAINKSVCTVHVNTLKLKDGKWIDPNSQASAAALVTTAEQERARALAERDALNRGDVQVRTVPRRQVFIGGRPDGAPFE